MMLEWNIGRDEACFCLLMLEQYTAALCVVLDLRGGDATGLSRPVAQCDPPTRDVAVTCGDKWVVSGSTSHELAALKLAIEEIRTIIISMQQEKSACGGADLPMVTPRHKLIKTKPTKEVQFLTVARNKSRHGSWADFQKMGVLPITLTNTSSWKLSGDEWKINTFDIRSSANGAGVKYWFWRGLFLSANAGTI